MPICSPEKMGTEAQVEQRIELGADQDEVNRYDRFLATKSTSPKHLAPHVDLQIRHEVMPPQPAGVSLAMVTSEPLAQTAARAVP